MRVSQNCRYYLGGPHILGSILASPYFRKLPFQRIVTITIKSISNVIVILVARLVISNKHATTNKKCGITHMYINSGRATLGDEHPEFGNSAH